MTSGEFNIRTYQIMSVGAIAFLNYQQFIVIIRELLPGLLILLLLVRDIPHPF